MNNRNIILAKLILITIITCSCSLSQRFNNYDDCLSRVILNSEKFPIPSAHRGLRSAGPDDSASSILGAINEQLPLMELDVRKNYTGTLFLFHDKRISKNNTYTSNSLGGSLVEDLSNSQLQSIILSKHNEHILSFDDALTLLVKGHGIAQIDQKGESLELVRYVASEVMRNNAECNVILQCTKLESVKLLREEFPKIAILFRLNRIEDIEKSLQYRPDVIQLDEEILTADLEQLIHKRGSKILVKSLDKLGDNRTTWGRLIAKQVDIILTDNPLELRNFIKTRKG